MTETEQKIIEKAKNYINDLFSKDSSGHDADHSLRVYVTATKINKTEQGNEFLVALAALLHDVDDFKLFPQNKNYENARNFMTEEMVPEELQTQVIHTISQVSYKGKDSVRPDTLEGKIVQDADRLDAIGAIGIARTFAYGGAHGRKIYDKKDKPDPNKTFEEYKSGTLSSLSHFYEKLLLLKDLMNTKEGRKIAEKRHQFLVMFLQEFHEEIDD